ncbi:transcriptional regulator [Streptococcus pseudoporcinus]|uniref:Transcriptional regulator n=1 Tax=Streptococcus pseudoporcinus TaxID=361101 RepID=A0A4U9YYE8_9STRE|nr:transcription repressor NadR [Streptococcus pseudoporcinus]VTS31979.1 transcriptional regulator [Streptococcus pseudoporcinus]
MKADERRKTILEILEANQEPCSASQLAKKLEVSRQVIVGDIALLRALQNDIISTPKGYIMRQSLYSSDYTARLVCQHQNDQTFQELSIIVAHGGIISTVEVEHPLYGMLTAPLNIKSQQDILDFMAKVDYSHAELLSSLTNGLHSHLVSCPDQRSFEKIKEELSAVGILYHD